MFATPTFNFDNKEISDVEYSGVYNFSLYQNLLVKGEMPRNNNFFEVCVNEEFVRHFGYTNQSIINHEFNLNTVSEISNKDPLSKIIKDEIYFNQKITTIGQDAFLACASLQEIHLPDSVTTLGKEAFRFCLLNKDLKIGKGISMDKEMWL